MFGFHDPSVQKGEFRSDVCPVFSVVNTDHHHHRRRLMKAQEVSEDAVDTRVSCDGERGTVRYMGPVPPTAGPSPFILLYTLYGQKYWHPFFRRENGTSKHRWKHN